MRPRVYSDIPGFCKAETLDGIRKHGFVLTPGRYVGAEEQEEDGEPFEEKYPRLLAELEACFMESERLMGVVRGRLIGWAMADRSTTLEPQPDPFSLQCSRVGVSSRRSSGPSQLNSPHRNHLEDAMRERGSEKTRIHPRSQADLGNEDTLLASSLPVGVSRRPQRPRLR